MTEQRSGPNRSERSRFAPVVEDIIGRFEELHRVRDRALADGRQITRMSANAVRALHRGETDEADRLLLEAERATRDLTEVTLPYPNIYWAGYVQDAMKEFAEARLTSAMLRDTQIPTPADLAVEDAAYLNGLAEAASELRRDVLDVLRVGNLPRAEALLDQMDDVYSNLITVDFPDAVTGGLRRTTDQLRGVLERTRGDVTLAVRQDRLERALQRAESSTTR
jgi:translin